MHNHLRVLSRLANAPLFISEDKLSILSTNVILPILSSGKPLSDVGVSPTTKDIPQTNISVIKVFDSLVSKGGAGESGFTSYEGVTNSINAAIKNGANKLGFYIDSPGGEVSGLFGLTDLIKSLPSVYGIETFGFTDGSATSAAYAILNATQKRYVTSTSHLGSIGVIMSLVDMTKLDEKMGVSYTILRSKDEKALYNPHESLSQDVINKYSAILESLDTIFNEKMVSYNSGLTIDAIKTMNGNTFLADKALELNLVDQIVSSLDEVISLESSTSTTTTIGNTMTLEELKARVSALETENTTLKASVTNAVTKAMTDERARCIDIYTAAQTLKIDAQHVSKRLTAGTSKEDALDIFTAIAEAVGKTTAIDTGKELEATITKTVVNGADKVQYGDDQVSVEGIIAAAIKQVGVK
jgi:ClpP class serine protease